MHTPCLLRVLPSPAIFCSSGRNPGYPRASLVLRKVTFRGFYTHKSHRDIIKRNTVCIAVVLWQCCLVVLGSSILPITSRVFVSSSGVHVFGRRVQLGYYLHMFVSHAFLGWGLGYISTFFGKKLSVGGCGEGRNVLSQRLGRGFCNLFCQDRSWITFYVLIVGRNVCIHK